MMQQSRCHWLNQTHAGDCLVLLEKMQSDGVKVQACVTSPPYFGLRSYLPQSHPDKHLGIGTCRTFKGFHFAVFTERLIEPCVLAGSRTGEVILAPFMGSGTTGMVAQRLGRHFIGCELVRSFIDQQHLHG